MVPIIDRTGSKVLAFGGRILPLVDDEAGQQQQQQPQNSDFKPPKYLNSPETPVFSKKSILFGHSIAMEEFQSRTKTKKPSPNGASSNSATADPLLIVEGYMDVLALWDVGIKTAVASMGTAISLEQITAAAKMAASNGGMFFAQLIE